MIGPIAFGHFRAWYLSKSGVIHSHLNWDTDYAYHYHSCDESEYGAIRQRELDAIPDANGFTAGIKSRTRLDEKAGGSGT
jgi:hypothetical protein